MPPHRPARPGSDPGATARFVDRMGLVFAADGFPRIAGQIFATLILAEDDLALDELAVRLLVSKASVSTNARMLEERGYLERLGRPGDRRDFYRIAPDLFERLMAQRLARWERFEEALDVARTEIALPPRASERLDELDAAYEHVRDAIDHALGAWRARKHGARPRPGRRR